MQMSEYHYLPLTPGYFAILVVIYVIVSSCCCRRCATPI